MPTALFAAPLIPKFRAFTAAGAPLAGGKLYSYVAGSSTPLATYPTYADALAGTNANANPVILDANGEANVFGQATPYKLILEDAAGVMQWTEDAVGVGQGSPFPAVDQWVRETGTIVYSSATQFKVSGADRTSDYHVGRRIKTVNTGGTIYSTVTSSSFSTDTTVNVANDSGTLDSGLSAVSYGLLSITNPSFDPPKTCVSVIKNGDQTAISTAAKITAWTEQIDSQSEFSTPTFTAKYPGKYLVLLSLEFLDTNADAVVTGYIYVNGSAVRQSVNRADDTSSEIKSMSLHWVGSLSAGGTVEAYAAGTATTIKGTSGTCLSITRLVGA